MPQKFDILPSDDGLYPGYPEAVARENRIRGAACLGWKERVCGCDVKPLTAYHLRRLTYAKSPFLAKVTAEELCENPDNHAALLHHAMVFLWTISPMFSEAGAPASCRRWWKFWHRPIASNRDLFNQAFSGIMKLEILEVCRQLLDYIDEAYTDSEDAAPSADTASYFAFEIGLARELHAASPKEFRLAFWNADCPRNENPVHVPLKLIFGMRKARLKAAGETVTNRSDAVKSAGLAELGKRLRGGDSLSPQKN